MPNLFEQMLQLDQQSGMRLVAECNKHPDEQTPENARMADELTDQFAQLAFTPAHLVPPHLHLFCEDAIKAMRHVVFSTPDAQERKRRSHLMLPHVLHAHPLIMAMQDQVDLLLHRIGEQRTYFSLPAMMNSISKHLNRQQEFFIDNLSQPNDAEMTAQLLDLRIRKPTVHSQLIRILYRASMYKASPHVKGCTCILCAYIASLVNAGSSSKASSSC